MDFAPTATHEIPLADYKKSTEAMYCWNGFYLSIESSSHMLRFGFATQQGLA